MLSKLPPRYSRKGGCLRCGACCVAEGCKHFEPADGFNVATCLIYGYPERPERCGLFPEMPPIPFETCGFYFDDTWDGGVVRPGDFLR